MRTQLALVEVTRESQDAARRLKLREEQEKAEEVFYKTRDPCYKAYDPDPE